MLQQLKCVSVHGMPTLLLCMQGVVDRSIQLMTTLLNGTTRPLITLIFGYGGLKVPLSGCHLQNARPAKWAGPSRQRDEQALRSDGPACAAAREWASIPCSGGHHDHQGADL